jgi:hypothetical protein
MKLLDALKVYDDSEEKLKKIQGKRIAFSRLSLFNGASLND